MQRPESQARAARVIKLWIAFTLAACSRAPEPAPVKEPEAPTLPPYALSAPATMPVLFAPDIISTGDFESHPAFTPDGSTLYFVKSDPEFSHWSIYQSQFAAGRWSAPLIAPFSGVHRDADPFITADGQHFYFISDRPVNGVARADTDIWVMDRTPQGWSEPRNPGEPVNSAQSEWHPFLTVSGILYFGSARPGGLGLTDLYRAQNHRGGWQVDDLGAPVNTASDEYEPMIAADESYLIFMAVRPAGRGASHLYLSWHRDGAWTEPVDLAAPINSDAIELAPYLSPDGKYFFFASTRVSGPKTTPRAARPGNGLGDIYQMDISAVVRDMPPSAAP
jgi:WD40-like Beta Propeller Repeat